MEYNNLPDLKHLATLKLVVELGGVAAAGNQMNIGQPAVTKRLRALDKCYGVTLMYRKGRALGLTPSGEKVYQYACLLVDHQLSLLESLEYLRDGLSKCRLEVTFAVGDHMLPDLLVDFAQNYPEYTIDTRMGYSRRIETRLATGLSDVALLEQQPSHPNIHVEKWLDDEIILVCSPHHHASSREYLQVKELNEFQYVLREENSSIRKKLDKILSENGLSSISVAMEVGSTDTIIKMLRNGHYVSFLPRFAVQDAINRRLLVQLTVEGLTIKRTLWAAVSKASADNYAVRAFVDVLRRQTKIAL